jgi:hypothetical protein
MLLLSIRYQNDKVTVAVPAAALFAKAGYLDASIMSFVDVCLIM